jgi:hypothetical protein
MNLYPLYQGEKEFETFEETDKAETGTLRPNS